MKLSLSITERCKNSISIVIHKLNFMLLIWIMKEIYQYLMIWFFMVLLSDILIRYISNQMMDK